jgi:hypothetical protein
VDPTACLLHLLETDGRRLHRLQTRLTLRDDAADDLLQELFLPLRSSAGFRNATDRAAFAVRNDAAELPRGGSGVHADERQAGAVYAVGCAVKGDKTRMQRTPLLSPVLEMAPPLLCTCKTETWKKDIID